MSKEHRESEQFTAQRFAFWQQGYDSIKDNKPYDYDIQDEELALYYAYGRERALEDQFLLQGKPLEADHKVAENFQPWPAPKPAEQFNHCSMIPWQRRAKQQPGLKKLDSSLQKLDSSKLEAALRWFYRVQLKD